MAEASTAYGGGLTAQDMFYGAGAVIVLLGVALFVDRIWFMLTDVMRSIVILGGCCCLYALAYYIRKRIERAMFFSRVFFLIFILLLPLGVKLVLDMMGLFQNGSDFGLTLIFLIIFIPYFVSWYYLREKVFFTFSVFAASGVAVYLTNLVYFHGTAATFNAYAYRILLLGIAWAALAQWSRKHDDIPTPFLNAVGFITALGAGFAILLYDAFASQPTANVWPVLFPLALCIAFFASVRIQSRGAFVIGAIYTIFYIAFINTRYFKNALSWPIAVILGGLIIMATGYFGWLGKNNLFSHK